MSDDKDRFDAFGLPTTPLEENPLFADPEPEELESVDAPEVVTEEITPEIVAEEPEEVVPEAASTEEVEETGEEETTVEELIFGKYKDLDAAKQGYDNLRDLQRRTAERAREYEQSHNAVLAQAQELETTLKQAIPYIQQLEKERQDAGYGGYDVSAPAAPVTPEQIDLMVRSRTDELRRQFEAEAADRAAIAERETAVYSFYEKHPEIEVEGELDGIMYDAVKTLNQAWEKTDTEVNVGDVDVLEIVYEASKSPELMKVLQLNPSFIDDDQGMTLARFQAALLRGETPITQQTQQVPASQVGQRKLPVTERASTGGSPPPQQPLNEWQEAVQAHREDRKVASGSPFFE